MHEGRAGWGTVSESVSKRAGAPCVHPGCVTLISRGVRPPTPASACRLPWGGRPGLCPPYTWLPFGLQCLEGRVLPSHHGRVWSPTRSGTEEAPAGTAIPVGNLGRAKFSQVEPEGRLVTGPSAACDAVAGCDIRTGSGPAGVQPEPCHLTSTVEPERSLPVDSLPGSAYCGDFRRRSGGRH